MASNEVRATIVNSSQELYLGASSSGTVLLSLPPAVLELVAIVIASLPVVC